MRTLAAFASLLAIFHGVSSQPVQVVAVGENGLAFTPDTLTAAVGSQVQFQFYPRNHSVASSAYGSPCQPDGEIFSGYFPLASGVDAETFVITVNDTDPIWFYCSQNVYTHCQAGMVGVINPPPSGSQTLAAYQRAAADTPGGSSGDLSYVAGGVVELLASGTNTTSTTSTTSTTTMSTSQVSSSSLSAAALTTSSAGGVVVATTTVRNSACPATTGGPRRRRVEKQREI